MEQVDSLAIFGFSYLVFCAKIVNRFLNLVFPFL